MRKKKFLKMRRITQWLNSIMTLNDLPSIPDLCIDLFFTPLFCMYWLANKELFCYFCPLKAFYLQRERKHFIKHHCVLCYIYFFKVLPYDKDWPNVPWKDIFLLESLSLVILLIIRRVLGNTLLYCCTWTLRFSEDNWIYFDKVLFSRSSQMLNDMYILFMLYHITFLFF